MPFCANCGWEYRGPAQFCRQCGRPLYRSPGRAQLQVVPPAASARAPAALGWPALAALSALGLTAGATGLATRLAATTAAAGSFPLDEAWVRLVYARALATTAALEFNSGLPDPGVGSLLWVGLLAALIKTLGALGISVIALAKGASLLFGALAAPLAAELTRRLTLERAAGLAAGLLVALDPAFAFASAGGLEATLLAALGLGALLAFAAGQGALCGALLGLAILTRVEAVGLALLLGLAAVGPPLARLRRDPGSLGRLLASAELGPSARPVWRRVAGPALALGGPVAALLLWLGRNGLAAGWMLPRATGVPHLPDLPALWRGYLDPWVGLLGGGAWVVAAPTIVLGAVVLARSRGPLGLATGLVPLLLALGAAAVAPPTAGPWPFALRHRIDPVLPLLAVLLVVGLGALWRGGRALGERRRPAVAPGRGAWAVAVVGASLLAALWPVAASLGLWARAPGQYLREAQALADTYVAAGRLARDSAPEEALIAALEPGALRYVSRRPVADLTGQHSPAVVARDPVEALVEARAQYAALPATPIFESLPSAALQRRLGEGEGTIAFFRLALGAPVGPRDAPYAFPTEALRRLDYLDVGNEAGERAHAYVALGLTASVRRTSRITPDAAVDDDGRRFVEGESFELQAEPGRDLILARRYEATAPAPLRLTVDGQPAGEWAPRAGHYVLAEETVRIPGGLVRRPRVSIAVQPLPGPARQATSFAYWAFVDR